MEYRNIRNENQVLRNKNQQQQQPQQISRVALRDINTNQTNAGIVGNGIGIGGKPAQRVQVYGDENSGKTNSNLKTTTTITNRQPLTEIRNFDPQHYEMETENCEDYEHLIDGEDEQDDDEEVEVEQIEQIDGINQVEDADDDDEEDDDEEEDDEIPQALLPILNDSINRELFQVYKEFRSKPIDEDDEDIFDVAMVSEYSSEIFNYIHSLEIRLRPNPNYMEFQTELKWNMRSILIDWLVQVHSRFNLLPETLFLTVNYIDRFLSKRKVSLSRFQLVGAVALFIAAKYEEINCPSVQEIAYMVDHAYSIEDILRAERFMIDVLEFEMGWPGPMSFLRRTSKADDYDYETRTLAKYFLEITIMDYRFVSSPPSWLAAGAHYLSRLLLSRGEWTKNHIFYSGYTSEQLKPLATILLNSCRNPEEHHKSIFEKYQERRFRRSSLFVQEWIRLSDC